MAPGDLPRLCLDANALIPHHEPGVFLVRRHLDVDGLSTAVLDGVAEEVLDDLLDPAAIPVTHGHTCCVGSPYSPSWFSVRVICPAMKSYSQTATCAASVARLSRSSLRRTDSSAQTSLLVASHPRPRPSGSKSGLPRMHARV